MPGSWEATAFVQWTLILIITIVVHQCWFHLSTRHTSMIQSSVESSTPPATKFKRKALLTGISNYQHEFDGDTGAHADVLSVRQLLIDRYHYNPCDIVMLIDNNQPDQVQPTRDNMASVFSPSCPLPSSSRQAPQIQKMNDLVHGARQGDRFFFYFAGIAMQEPSDDVNEEDGLDELIVTCDNHTIRDNELFQLLAKPLPIGSTLVTVFDTSHSGSLLDLKHSRCNGIYVPWFNKGFRRSASWHNIVVRKNAQQDITIPSYPSLVASSPPSEWYGTPESPIPSCDSPESVYCDGRCRETVILQHENGLDADIICLSAAKEDQYAWSGGKLGTMTQILVKILEKNLNPSLKDLLTVISHDIHAGQLELHTSGRLYKRQIRDFNKKRVQRGKHPIRSREVETNNFQEPQISSPLPLDMSRRWQL